MESAEIEEQINKILDTPIDDKLFLELLSVFNVTPISYWDAGKHFTFHAGDIYSTACICEVSENCNLCNGNIMRYNLRIYNTIIIFINVYKKSDTTVQMIINRNTICITGRIRDYLPIVRVKSAKN